jgi:signal transduction histidine kinase
MPIDYSKTIVVNITEEGETTTLSMLNMSEEDYSAAIETVLGAEAISGDIDIAGRPWRYSREQNMQPEESFSMYQYSIVFLDIDDMQNRLRALAMNFLVIGIFAIAVILLISALIANRAILPVEESMARQRRFVADASHELKTPIAVIAANAEAARDAALAGTGISTTHWIDNIVDETTRMEELVESLLNLAKTKEIRTVYTHFDLTAVACEEADRVEVILFERNITFDFVPYASQNESLIVRSDRAKVQAALSVLLENAVKYTPEKGRVVVSVGKKSVSSAFVSVSNTGVYIPPEDISHIFERFYRADRSRNSDTGGHGIGLSLAKEIALSLGGELTASSVPHVDGGATNIFTLSI